MPVRRVVVFADSGSLIGRMLVGAALGAVAARGDLEIAAVCDTRRVPPPPLRADARDALAGLVRRLFDREQTLVLRMCAARSLEGVARRAGAPFLVPPERDVNHPELLERLAALRADFGLVLYCSQRFRAPLLGALERVVNYHDGLLPAYRGLCATEWSIHAGEAVTGFSFHAMTEGIDEGPVLLEGTIPVRSGISARWHVWEKAARARACLDGVLDLLVAGAPGREQAGPAGYFGAPDARRIRMVDDPSALTRAEVERRLSAFGLLLVALDGARVPVTRVRPAGRGGSRLAFATADGARLRVTRVGYLPPALHRAYRRLRGLRRLRS